MEDEPEVAPEAALEFAPEDAPRVPSNAPTGIDALVRRPGDVRSVEMRVKHGHGSVDFSFYGQSGRVRLYTNDTWGAGRALFTNRRIEKGVEVSTMTGELVFSKGPPELPPGRYSYQPRGVRCPATGLPGWLVLDPPTVQAPGVLINTSFGVTTANCEATYDHEAKLVRIVAKKTILANEELLYYYGDELVAEIKAAAAAARVDAEKRRKAELKAKGQGPDGRFKKGGGFVKCAFCVRKLRGPLKMTQHLNLRHPQEARRLREEAQQ